jgi:hypothetical protein
MKMIGHQEIGEALDRDSPLGFRKQVQEGAVVARVIKQRQPPHAAIEHMKHETA